MDLGNVECQGQVIAQTSRCAGINLSGHSGIIDIVFVTGGYFLCEAMMYGMSAAASIPANFIQGVSGLAIAVVLYPVLIAIPDINQMALRTKYE